MLIDEHDAIVQNNIDPEFRGRIQVFSPTLTGGEYPGWVEPEFCFFGDTTSGWIKIPPINSIIKLRIKRKGIEQQARYMMGVCRSLPDILKINYPDRWGFIGENGQYMIFDDRFNELFINYSSILLGDEYATEQAIKGTSFIDLFSQFLEIFIIHQHASAGAAPPSNAAQATVIKNQLSGTLSDVVKLI